MVRISTRSEYVLEKIILRQKFYLLISVGITVEGSNTLTRSLIIFGQGLNKSHPHFTNIFNAIQENKC